MPGCVLWYAEVKGMSAFHGLDVHGLGAHFPRQLPWKQRRGGVRMGACAHVCVPRALHWTWRTYAYEETRVFGVCGCLRRVRVSR